MARDTKCALRPAQNAIRPAGALPQKQIHLFASAEDGYAVYVRVEVTGNATYGSDRDDPGEEAFVALEDLEPGFGPEFAAVPVKFGAEAAQPRNGGGLLCQVFESQTGQRGAVGERSSESE